MRTQVRKLRSDFCHSCVTLLREWDLRDDFEFSKTLLIWCQYAHDVCAKPFRTEKIQLPGPSPDISCLKARGSRSVNVTLLREWDLHDGFEFWKTLWKWCQHVHDVCAKPFRTEKYPKFTSFSRNLAFRFRGNSIRMTLGNRTALKTCSGLIPTHRSELAVSNRSIVDKISQKWSKDDRASSWDRLGTDITRFRPNTIPLRASLLKSDVWLKWIYLFWALLSDLNGCLT